MFDRRLCGMLLVCAEIVAVVPGCTKPDPVESSESGSSAKSGSAAQQKPLSVLSVQRDVLGESEDQVDGETVTQYILQNRNGMTVSVLDYGAVITSIRTPDRKGKIAEVTLGFKKLARYGEKGPYFGAACGRFANRIAYGKFSIDGIAYQLKTNNGPHHLHGGVKGFNRRMWQAEILQTDEFARVTLTYTSKDGEENYPGTLETTVAYTLNNDNELKIEFTAITTDKPTHVNLTCHCYWNLAGEGDILGHALTLFCDRFLPVDETLIPTGEKKSVRKTPWDFTESKTIGSRINDPALGPADQTARGYDHCYIARPAKAGADINAPRLIARVHEPKSGRVMEVLTDQPSVQFYTGNFLDGKPENGGFQRYAGFCLECQKFPDTPNQEKHGFPSTLLRKDEVYRHVTVYRFSSK